MSPDSRTYYQTLQVDSAASQEVIEAAYRRLARVYHPDRNRGADATLRMQELNEAYGVLSDQQRRAAYDLELAARAREAQRRQTDTNSASTTAQSASSGRAQSAYNTTSQAEQWTSAQQAAASGMPVACQDCGRSDSTLRYAGYPYVLSFLIVTLRRGDVALCCEKCRKRRMLNAKILTGIMGWWGIPFGPIFTLMVLFGPNGGKIPSEGNAEYLRWLGAYFLQTGNRVEARKSFEESQKLAYDPRVDALLHELFASERTDGTTSTRKTRRWVFVGIAAVILLIALCRLSTVPTTTSVQTSSSRSVPTTTSVQTTRSGSLPTSTSKPADRPTASASGSRMVSGWERTKYADGAMSIEHPSGWVVMSDGDDGLELSGDDFGFALYWSDSGVEQSVTTMIERMQDDSVYAEFYKESTEESFGSAIEASGGQINSISYPRFGDIGTYKTVYFEVNASTPDLEDPVAFLLFEFECERYACQAMAYKSGQEAFSVEQWSTLKRVIGSADFLE